MQSLIKQFFFLVLLVCFTPLCAAQLKLNLSTPLYTPFLNSDPEPGLEPEVNMNLFWSRQPFSVELQKQHESGEFIITELPEMDLQEARTFLDTTLSNQLEERSLDHEIRVPCNRQSRKCDVEVYLFNQRESSKQLTEIIRFTVLLNLRPATVNTDSYHSSKIDKSGSNAHSGLEEESDSHCIASMSCPSASVSTTETVSLQESDLPDLDQDWMDRVHVYRNQENGDNLVIRDNIVYYTGKSLTVILSLFNTLLFQSGPIDTSDGYYGHFTNAHVLAEALAMGDTIPLLIRDHKLAYVTPQLDATGFALSLAIYVTYVYYWDNLTLDKRKMSGSDVRVFYAWKLFANIATKAIGEVAEQRVFANETDSDIHKIKSSLFTSLITALPYGTKLLVTAFTGNNYANHLLMAVPADHLLSCSISVNGVCIQLFFHRILGEADMTIVPATSLEPAKKVTSGLSYIPSAITQVAIGKAFNALGMTVCGGHYIKGAGYALVDGVDKYLIAQGASDLSRYTALTGGALFMSYSNYSFNRAFASGFSYRYAKYLMILASTAFMTLSEFYFHTTILR